MRILMLSDVYFPRVNGVSTAIQTYRQQLPAQGVASTLIAPRYTKGGEDEEENVIRLPGWTVPMDREDRFVRPGFFRQQAIRAAAQCDVVHIQTPFSAHGAGVAAARKLRLPVVSSYHTLFEEYLQHYAPFVPASWTKSLARNISRRQCNELDAVIVPSSQMRERLLEYGVTSPMHIVPTGIPLGRFSHGDRERFRQHYQIAHDRPVALYVGRAAYEKNIDFLIDATRIALRSQPRLMLLVAGEGPALHGLQEHARSQGVGDAVRFVGYLDRTHELPDCYAAADMFVFASHTETQGLVLLEAMAAGLPVVALAKMGTCDILVEESGAIAPPDELEAFAAAMVKVASDPGLRMQMRTHGRAWATSWSDETLTARLADLYRQLVNRTNSTESTWKAHSKERPA
ncbi:glycosyltransferase [Uliginosibacterium gangwonense]|uniref:glycosyltransferase n=1 Tax=Uliginosibacterium gangwonense TaxID=392736 RepID=UPI0003A2414B|nr:glycosyltransferase [Uliginosibacterium gangwonense]